MNSNQTVAFRIKRSLRRLEIDRAVFFGLLSRIWGLIAGPATAILIATFFSPEVQGYYYTFTTLLALQAFVELGLGTVAVQFASHEWSKLNLDDSGHIVGDGDALSRLISLAKLITTWFLVAGVLIAIGLGAAGYVFFSGTPNHDIDWVSPWLLLCVVTGLTIWLVPVWSLLEGCNQVATLNSFRFFQGVLASVVVWTAIFGGAELWTAPISGLAMLVCSAFFLRRRYWTFFKTLLLSKPQGPRIRWRTDMLPMQWRIALTWMSGYLYFSLFTPVLFKYHGPVVAGQMGMTWALVGAVGSIPISWLSPRVPQFGMLIAQKSYHTLDRLFWKTTRVVTLVTVLVALSIWGAVCLLNAIDHPVAVHLASRLLPPLPTGFFLLGQLLMVVSSPFSTYLRAHKEEPVMVVSVTAAIAIALATLILGRHFSATGVSIGYFLVHVVAVPFVFLIWFRCRAKWHAGDLHA
jgi:O-antigen/teichoic acid export membrane protein